MIVGAKIFFCGFVSLKLSDFCFRHLSSFLFLQFGIIVLEKSSLYHFWEVKRLVLNVKRSLVLLISCLRLTRILWYHSGYIICDGVALSSHADEIGSRMREVLTLYSREQSWVGQERKIKKKKTRQSEREKEIRRKGLVSILSLNFWTRLLSRKIDNPTPVC